VSRLLPLPSSSTPSQLRYVILFYRRETVSICDLFRSFLPLKLFHVNQPLTNFYNTDTDISSIASSNLGGAGCGGRHGLSKESAGHGPQDEEINLGESLSLRGVWDGRSFFFAG
jgi:hypothetical protein